MRAKTITVACLALAVLAGCGQPVPADKAAYVGGWQSTSPEMNLLITQDGRVEYLRKEGARSTSVNAPLQGFIGDDFEVGVGPMKTRFAVSAPPHAVGADWKMTVDGVELTRVSGDRST